VSRLRTFLPPAAALALLMGVFAAGSLYAQQDPLKGIGDPTRAPAGVAGKQSIGGARGSAVAAAQGASGASSPDGEAEKPKPVVLTLQAIRYDPGNGQAVAMINDELVEVGGKVSGLSVVSISRNVAVLKGPAGQRRLALLLESEEINPKSSTDKGGTAKRGRKEIK
jgi:hypothetical protein